MPQGALSAANVVQAKTGQARGTSASVGFDNPCQPDSAVTVELSTGGISLSDGGLAGNVPDGYELDAVALSPATNVRYCHAFRLPRTVGGEQGWAWSPRGVTADLHWRITEWDTALEPVSPLEAFSQNYASGTAPTSLSTGTAPPTGTTSRAVTVALAWHLIVVSQTGNTGTLSWGSHTGGFTQRDQLDWAAPPSSSWRYVSNWSWAFSTVPTAYETNPTITRAQSAAGDQLFALLVVYAATTYA